ncbi:nucleotide pyrophosphohydrolase [Veronia nyctiphanis]|uniref:Nucleotide pyrophosphohydrolase n=1 Tax=Veronia nyctiphanis TaxID=1278244 RepID=A0A4Q0YPJ8_9GAMM|nr:MazG nucleotide pyrophosphohydrolase domain-containing protein [Veronia nyctiphanis]RXJ72886.1 nucleotide pyrophosphohydrolase [Veronia nyctiphanis]
MTLSELQSQIKAHDHKPELADKYFLKLIEEVGELSEAVRKERFGQPTLENLKGSVAEELHDVIYYACALANVHNIDLTQTCQLKNTLNRAKYNR